MKNLKKALRRIGLIALSALMILPALIVPTFAEAKTYATQTFDGFTENATPATGDGYAAVFAHATYKKENDNVYMHVPYWGTGKDGNYDKALQINHDAITAQSVVAFEVDYRPHYGGTGTNPTFESQVRSFKYTNEGGTQQSGHYLNLYKINLQSGKIVDCGAVVANPPQLKMDQWNTVKLVLDLATTDFKIYLNGELYSEQTNLSCVSTDWKSEFNCSDIIISANQFIVGKCNKQENAYAEKDDATANYVDIDNVRIYEEIVPTYTLNGEVKNLTANEIQLVSGDKKLIYAEITPAGGQTYITTETSIKPENGMVIKTHAIDLKSFRDPSFRYGSPEGIRFITYVEQKDLDALLADETIKKVEIGTLIAPTLDVQLADRLSKKLFDAAGYQYLDVKATVGEWYPDKTKSGYYCFAGSIVDIKPENYNLSFTGMGYVEVTLQSGEVVAVYTETPMVKTSVAQLADTLIKEDNGLTAAQKKTLGVYSAKLMSTQELRDKYMEDLKGLNVLALGDSLFSGSQGNHLTKKQWVNLMGVNCEWNLTNLGVGGMTVSNTENNGKSGKRSMWERIQNYGETQFRWGTSSTPDGFVEVGSPDINSPEAVQLIILEGGCNDYGPAIEAPLGTLDSTDPGTYLGAWNRVTEYLLEEYPNAQIVFITTWDLNDQTRPNDPENSIYYSHSIVRLYDAKYADNPRIGIIDAGNKQVSGVDMLNSTWKGMYSFDSYHLNDLGMELMMKNMLPYIWNFYVRHQNGLVK